VELNRSERHPRLFSEFTRDLPPTERDLLLDAYYRRHRERVETAIRTGLRRGDRVLHLGIHSFVPVLDDETRTADLAFLYDPARRGEREFCLKAVRHLGEKYPGIRVRRNYPYRGNADGFTTYLRRRFSAGVYLGIEVEMNQGVLADPPGRALLGNAVLAVIP
jgi:predicted N-formylglutamate amidohydrolase